MSSIRRATAPSGLLSLGLLALALTGCPKKTDPVDNAGGAAAGGATGAEGGVPIVDATTGQVIGETSVEAPTFEGRMSAAVELLKKGDVESINKARKILDELAVERSDVAEVVFNQGVAAAALGNLDEARKFYLRATDIDPKLGVAWLNLGAVAERAGDLNKALSHYQTGLKYDPTNEQLVVGVIGALRRLGRRDEAISEAKKALSKNANNVDAYNNLGLVYVDQGNYDLALFIYQKALTIKEPSLGLDAEQNAALHCNLGKVYLLRNEPAVARKELERSLELDPTLVPSLMFLANDRLDNRDWAKAAEYLERAAVLEPENPAIHMNLGIAYRGLGRYDDAKAAYEKTLAIDRSNADPYLNLAALYGEYIKDYDVALTNIQKYRDSGGRDLAMAAAWQADIEAQKAKAEAQKEREKKRKEREARDAERKRLAEQHEADVKKWEQENQQAPPDGTATPPDGSAPAPDGSAPAPAPAPEGTATPPADGATTPAPTEGTPWGGDPAPAPAPADPAPSPAPTEPAPSTEGSPWGGTP